MTRLTTQFGFHSTATEVAHGIDLSGKNAIVTGAASGIGVETARALAGAGAAVTLAVRDTEAGRRVADDLRERLPNATLHVAPLDVAAKTSIAAFVAAWEGPLHILVNNAGVMASPERRTPEGWELQFATNHLGHMALTLGLRHALVAAGSARVVSVSSSGHMGSPVIFDDLHFRFRPYDPWLAYGQSKTANILFAVAANQRWARAGMTVNALHPGSISTNLQRHVDAEELARVRARLGASSNVRKTAEQGAATSVLLATSPLVEGIGGRYFADCNEQPVVTERTTDMTGVAAYALDPDNADHLWDVSVRLLTEQGWITAAD